jgi:hypothetical protein
MPRAASPYNFPGANADVMRQLSMDNEAKFDVNSQKANANYELQQMQGQQGLALSGLNQMSSARQQSSDLANSQYGALADLLRNLYR